MTLVILAMTVSNDWIALLALFAGLLHVVRNDVGYTRDDGEQ